MQTRLTTLLAPLLLIPSLLLAAGNSPWIDAVSLSLGTDDNSNDTNLFRIGFQNRWERSWFHGGAWYLSGYWDAEFAYMESDIGSDNDLLDLSITPMLRYQRDASLSSGAVPYAEAGIGAHLISDTKLGERDLRTALQFGSVVGIGMGFGGRGQYELSYRFQHISNADIKKPNDGLDLHLLRLGYNFT